MKNRKPRLLRETVEIALTEIKRFLEPQLMERFQLRRVSAPLFLPVGSPLLQREYPGARVRLAGGEEVEIVGALDFWLRSQLKDYDIAPGFGVYTVMNAMRPGLMWNSISSPHVAAWSWQQSVLPQECTARTMRGLARKMYQLLVDTEKMILELFPHLHSTLAKEMEVASEADLAERFPDYMHQRRMYLTLHPGVGEEDGCRAVYVERSAEQSGSVRGELWVWNRTTGSAMLMADFAARSADGIAQESIGGNIYRENLSLVILHQNSLLTGGR